MACNKKNRGSSSYNSIQKMGVISDTHGLLEQVVFDFLKGTELILHAGDIGDGRQRKTRETEFTILTKLRSIAPVLAVRGNVDTNSLLPTMQMFDLNNGCVRGIMIHGHEHRIKWSQKDVAENKAPEIFCSGLARFIKDGQINMLVFGHSHIPGVVFSQGVLYINPGSAGPKRFSLPRTLVYVGFTDDKVMVKIYDITKQCIVKNLEITKNALQ